jgi:hypothetical protein
MRVVIVVVTSCDEGATDGIGIDANQSTIENPPLIGLLLERDMIIVVVIGVRVPIIEDGSGAKGSGGFGDWGRGCRFEATAKG